ncbi:hypothetical protein L9F63_017080, partial [Diploptera punctata]
NNEVAKLLLEAGGIASPDIYNDPKAMRTYKRVLAELDHLQVQDSEGNSLLHIECYRSASVLNHLEAKTDTNVADKHGITPLHIVSYTGNTSNAKLLLENKADPNKKDEN